MLSKVKFEVLAGLYCDFLNYLIDKEFYISHISSTDFGFTAYCLAKDYAEIAKLARKFQSRTKVLKRKGVYFKTRFILKRKGILVGLCLIFACMWSFNNLIWRIDVLAPYQNISEDIYTILYQNDICAGSVFSLEKNKEVLDEIFVQVENVGYVTLNFSKGILTCKVDPTVNKMPYLENQTAGNITASADGVIEELQIYSGFSQIKIGQSVSKGEILVSSSLVDQRGTLQQTMPRAYIKAYCLKEYEAEVEYEKVATVRTGEMKETAILKFLGKDIPLKKANIDKWDKYDVQRSFEYVNFLGFRFPLTIEKVKYYEKKDMEVKKDENTATIAAKNIIDTLIKNDPSLIEIEQTSFSEEKSDKSVKVFCKVFGYYDITK